MKNAILDVKYAEEKWKLNASPLTVAEEYDKLILFLLFSHFNVM